MMPTFFQLGRPMFDIEPIMLVIAWVVWSFLFWRNLRDLAVQEDKIFHMMFASTLVGFLTARLMYVVMHWGLFSETVLRIFTLWIEPGMAVIPMLMSVVAILMTQSRLFGIPRSYTIDAFAKSFGVAYIIGCFGGLTSGFIIGKLADLPFAIRYLSAEGLRHPVQMYEIIFLFFLLLFLNVFFVGKIPIHERKHGMFAVWFFLLFSLGLFFIEMTKENSVYWGKLTANQWMLVGIGSESTGVLFVWGHAGKTIKMIARRIYSAISHRFDRNHQNTP
jgi:prolipoprotein diacylglyceryltransferase